MHLSSAAAYGNGLSVIQRLYRVSKPLSALSNADTILCLDFDTRYAQSVVETELHHAKRSGAKLITLNDRKHNLCKFADEWLQPDPDKKADLLEMLFEFLRYGDGKPQLWSFPPQAQRSARLLLESKQPVILVGSSCLTYPDNLSLLEKLEQLLTQLHAELILLPENVNLGGALQMGITAPLSTTELQHMEVLHVIGEALPARLSFHPFVLYQNICPPSSTLSSGLVLPAAAFTEEEGTFIDHAGEMRWTHRAVQAPGSALPSWQILCRIAQKLGVQGFEYENEVQIRAEMESMNWTGAENERSVLNPFEPEAAVFPSVYCDDHAYMGFPLRTWVAGFQALCPEPPLRIK
jgi:NADH dehydrogenase/NADH:ubiquinone oxidoreductase subunit G